MTVEVFWGEEPSVRSEVQFLDQLKADLTSRGTSAIILANFFTHQSSRQIDFLVVTDNHVSHVELKNYTAPLVGHTNGPWSSRRSDSSLEIIDRQNPYTQAQECKLALSDDMHALSVQDSSIPSPPQGRKFYTQIDSVVCIFPRLVDGSQVPDDFKVKTLGYADFLRFLTRPGAHPQWNRDHWEAFIRMMALADATISGQEIAVNTAQQEVRDYSRRFKEFTVRVCMSWCRCRLITVRPQCRQPSLSACCKKPATCSLLDPRAAARVTSPNTRRWPCRLVILLR